MKVRCISSFGVRNNSAFWTRRSSKDFQFLKDSWYDFTIQKHEETGQDIYCVDGLPMMKRTFDQNFDTTSLIREEKLKNLLDE